jgi:hypothetical protein
VLYEDGLRIHRSILGQWHLYIFVMFLAAPFFLLDLIAVVIELRTALSNHSGGHGGGGQSGGKRVT